MVMVLVTLLLESPANVSVGANGHNDLCDEVKPLVSVHADGGNGLTPVTDLSFGFLFTRV